MGQKTHPIGLRLGIIRSWNSRWYAPDRNFADLIHEDMMIKRYISKRLDNAGIAKVMIARAPKRVTVIFIPPVPVSLSDAREPKLINFAKNSRC